MKKTTLKSLLAVALVFMLAFTSLIPAMAASITIKPAAEGGTNTDVENRFAAYQIFSGEVVAPNDSEEAAGINKLSNIVWGEKINGEALITALKAVTAVEITVIPADNENPTATFSELVSAAVDGKTAKAAALAELLDTYSGDSTFVETFAKTVGKYIEDNNIEASGTSEVNEDGNFVIDVDPGYYIVIDTYKGTDNNDDERSAYILKVANDRELFIKSEVPTIDKEIVGAKDGNANGTTAEIGSTVTFQLTGTLSSENFGRYEKYFYKFIDTLSKGLTLDASTIQITAKKDGAADIDITKDFRGTYTVSEVSAGGEFTITFEDIQKVTGLTGDYKIVVTYDVTVNEDAAIYGEANSNKAKLEFSNDPYGDGTGETTEDVVYVTSFDLDFVKQDSSKNALAGATFKLKDSNGNYANLNKVTETEKEGIVLQLDDETPWAGKTGGSSFTTDTTGKFSIEGLAAGTYYLEEVKAPDNYSKIDDIQIDITVTFNDNGTVATKTVTVTAANSATTDVGKNADGSIYITNFLISELPSTGGMGTTVFYVLGCVVLAAAVVFFAISRKKAHQ